MARAPVDGKMGRGSSRRTPARAGKPGRRSGGTMGEAVAAASSRRWKSFATAAVDSASSGVDRLTASPLSLLAFLFGVLGWIQTTFVAVLYMEEIFLLAMAVMLPLFSRASRRAFSEPIFKRLLIAFLITMVGYVLSDLSRGSQPENYLRGWGRLVLTMTSFVGMVMLATQHRQAIWWFAVGRGIGGVLSLKFVEHLHLFGSWKYAVDDTGNFSSFGFAEYVGSAVAGLVWFLPSRWAVIAFLALGGFSFHLDFRYHAGICMAIAFLLYFRIGADKVGASRQLPIGRMILVAVLGLGALAAGYKLSENPGAAGRRAVSDEGRLVGLTVGTRALFESPLIGYGSWGRSPEIAAIEKTVLEELYPEGTQRRVTGVAAIVHSELFQSWLEGGALGAAFFVAFLLTLLKGFPRLCLERRTDALLPVLLYWYLFALWEVVNAPFGANSRMHIALGAATAVIVAIESKGRIASRS